MPVKRKPISAEFFNFDEQVLRIIAEEYDIPDVDSFCPILLDGDICSLLEVRSETSRKIIIETTDRMYFLKQVPWYCDDEPRLKYSHAFQDSLHALGIPVAPILRTRRGDTWVEINNSKFVLFGFLRGVRYMPSSRDMVVSSAQTLARIHDAPLITSAHSSEDIFELADAHIRLLYDLEILDSHEPIFNLMSEIVAQERKKVVVSGWGDLGIRGIHGDYNPWNLLFSGNHEVTAVLDFDNCDIGQRLHDIGEALITFCCMEYEEDSTNFAARIPSKVDNLKAEVFLQAYHSISQITSVEYSCLPSIIRTIFVEFSCLGLIRGDYRKQDLAELEAWLTSPIELTFTP